MKYTVSTKPLIEALDLGIVDANINRLYKPSIVVKITASKDGGLIINHEVDRIRTRLVLKGAYEGPADTTFSIFVDVVKFKGLIATLDANSTSFEFVESESLPAAPVEGEPSDTSSVVMANSLILHSGTSKFTLPSMLDEDIDVVDPASPVGKPLELKQDAWKFIKDHQMYALTTSFLEPVYTNVWVGDNGDVLTGDFDQQIFTHSAKSNLSRSCLLVYTIINLVNSLPKGALLFDLGDSYLVSVDTDSFSFAAEFRPSSEEETGSYHSEWILPLIAKSGDGLTVKVADMLKVLSQSKLLAVTAETTIDFTASTNKIHLEDENVNCNIEAKGESVEYTLTFKPVALLQVLSKCSEETITIRPMYRDIEDGGRVMTGINIDSNELTVLLPATSEVTV